MGPIFQVNEADSAWTEFPDAGVTDGRAHVRVKGLTRRAPGVPPVQYVEYAPGHTDPVHRHDTDEFFIVTEGSFWLEGSENGPGSVVFVPRDTDYALRAGDAGARYFRVVIP